MKYKKVKILIFGTLFLAFLCISVPKATYTKIDTVHISSTYVPEGLIAMWSGTLDSIPDGWVLCDGTQFTPNTSGRFIYNTDGIEDAGATGGDDSHLHSYTEVPYHDHGVTGVSSCSHNHPYNHPAGTILAAVGSQSQPALLQTTQSIGVGGSSHTHTTTTDGVAIGYTSEIDNLYPPYYKLAFIKKITESSIIPVGIILIWPGDIEQIPQGWVVCNGSLNTPNLENRYIMGVTDENPGTIGGNLTHFHTYTDIPSHSHTTTAVSADHTHSAYCVTTMVGYSPLGTSITYPTEIQYTEYHSVPHSHSMNGVGQSICTTEETNHEPPFTTIAYIMNTQSTEGIPTDCVSLWDDTTVNVPIGWGQCDGTQGTLDLRENFLKGQSLGEPIGTTGGALTHTHVYTEVPYHTHTIQTSSMNHRHQLYELNDHLLVQTGGGTVNVFTSWTTGSTGTSNAAHSHDILPAGIVSPHTNPESNLPPYIELTYIQHISPITTISWVSPEEDSIILFPRAPTVQFDFEYLWTGVGNDITLSFTNGTDDHDAGSVLGLDHVFIPYLAGDVTATFHLKHDATELITATRSFTFTNNRDPTVTLVHPNGGEVLSGTYEVTWTGSDADGDQVYYSLEYNSKDTGWVEITSGLTGTSYNWDTTTTLDSDSVELRIIAEDAFGGQAIDKNDAVFTINNESGNGPRIPGYNIAILVSLIVITSLLLARKRKM